MPVSIIGPHWPSLEKYVWQGADACPKISEVKWPEYKTEEGFIAFSSFIKDVEEYPDTPLYSKSWKLGEKYEFIKVLLEIK